MQRELTIAVLVAVVVFTSYFGFQALSVVSQSYYSRGLIVQARLTSLQFLINSAAISNGYFMADLTFENPTREIMNLTRLEATYYETLHYDSYSADSLIAKGEINTPKELAPGSSLVSVRTVINPYYSGNASLVSNTKWLIRFYPQMGLTTYEMIATVKGSAIKTEGPYMATGHSEPYVTLNTYAFLTIDFWAIGLEIIAVSLIIKARTEKTGSLAEKGMHYIMLPIIYALQGVGFLAAPYYFQFVNLLVPQAPPDPYYIPYGFHGAGGILFELLLFAAFVLGIAFLSLAGVLFIRVKWARTAAFVVSVLFAFGWLYFAVLFFQSFLAQELIMLNLLLALLFLLTAIAHGIAAYVASRRPSLPSQTQLRTPSMLTADETK